MKTIIRLAALLLLRSFVPEIAHSQSFNVGQAGTLSTMVATCPAFPTIYDEWNSGIQPSFSFADSINGPYPDGSFLDAHATGTTGTGVPISPQRVKASITSYGTSQYLAAATTYSVAEWLPIPHNSASMGMSIKAHLNGSVSLGGGSSLFSSVNPVYVQFALSAAICRADQGEYVVEQGMDFETSGTLGTTSPGPFIPDFRLEGSLTLDDWEENYDGNTVIWTTDVTTNIQFRASAQETYWIIVSFAAGADIESQGQASLEAPITAAANFGDTFTLEFVPDDPEDKMVPLPPRRLLVAASPGGAYAPDILVTGQPGGTVTLQASTDLQNWTDVSNISPFPGTWNPGPLALPLAPARFFRVRQQFPVPPQPSTLTALNRNSALFPTSQGRSED